MGGLLYIMMILTRFNLKFKFKLPAGGRPHWQQPNLNLSF